MVAPDPFKTDPPTTKRGRTTYDTIAARLAALNPPIVLKNHIAQSEKQGWTKDAFGTATRKNEFSTLEAKDSTLDGINFIAANPARLVSALEDAKDEWGERALSSMRED